MEMTVQLAPQVKPDISFELEQKILDRSAKLGVLGLGYVGLPLMLEMARSGFSVTGIDIDGRHLIRP
jgi:UDP-N-acetyl-D-glucosamine dehydrogenase